MDVSNKDDDGPGLRKYTQDMPTLTLLPDQDFDLDLTLSCGQAFRWSPSGEGWQGVVEGELIRIRQDDRENKLIYEGATETCICRYFALDQDLNHILQTITDRDPEIRDAIGACRGLRILRQDPWECTLSYLIATYSNIPTIRKRIEALAHTLGQECTSGNTVYYGFPGPEAFAEVCGSSLDACRLGYRGPYLEETACRLARDPGWAARIRDQPYEEGRKELMSLRGIGPKAADCILLFAFQRYEAFPVDVWIRRIMQERYPVLREKSDETIRRFGQERFGAYAGYAQEYLYAARQVPTSQASR
jgi:N-glycosylase/DNA lyase